MTRNLLEYLESNAVNHSDKIAVSLRNDNFTFGQLCEKAKGLGKAIKTSERYKKGKAVAVIADRDINTIAYFMGVLYSGCYYIPLDPELPAEKLEYILNENDPVLIIGNKEFRESFTSNCRYDYLSIEDAVEAECGIPLTDKDTPMYLIYTSGSTGKPKGVIKSHAQGICFIEAYSETFGFDSDEVIGNQTPFFFDASAKDIFLMLKLGCTMEILPTQLFSMPTELIEYMNEKKVTFASWVPTAISIVAQLNPFSLVKPEYLRRVFFVGEVMPMKHLNKWRKALPDIQYVNLYGQSELSGICAYYEVKDEFDNSDTLPIGKALSNSSLYLVDEKGIITESDRIGEIYIVSDALASAYYNDEEKTNESFVLRDFGEGPVRCFRTGDLASYDKEGNIVFAARSDYQIKHMGHRIELGEIEAVAGALPVIDRCCCLYNSSKKRIVLICQLSPGYDETPVTIMTMLKDRLSSYMMPGRILIEDKLPLNANGKIDRQKLKTLI